MLFILVLSWVFHDTRMQLITVMLIVYTVVALFTLLLAAMSAGPSGGWIIVTAAAFLVLLASVFVMGQGLVLEGRHLDGWLLSILVIVLVLLAVSLPGVPQLRSNLSRTISNPFLYTGPVGWLTGCSAATPQAVQTEAPATEKEVEATMMAVPTPSPMPTAIPQPQGTATPLSVPFEPYPFRQIFPETLYWAPEVQTNADGTLDLDITMADSLTTWRLTAFGSTQEGDIGAAMVDLRVFQDFFIDVEIPMSLPLGQTASITLTVYSYLDTPQKVRWDITPSADYRIEIPPQDLNVDAHAAASTTFKLIPQRSGNLVLQVSAIGDVQVDAVRINLDITAP
ncbi:MAG: hypothetical protein E4H27_05560 [Anaerolineales bacterium]|nr:MAG: hypothetical protein E4H27_05560 [Anaerolineales bacterium]